MLATTDVLIDCVGVSPYIRSRNVHMQCSFSYCAIVHFRVDRKISFVDIHIFLALPLNCLVSLAFLKALFQMLRLAMHQVFRR